jgi:hypothetical protein
MSSNDRRWRQLIDLSTEELKLRLGQIEAELSATTDPEQEEDQTYSSTVLPGIEEEYQLLREILFTRLEVVSDEERLILRMRESRLATLSHEEQVARVNHWRANQRALAWTHDPEINRYFDT